MGRPTKYKPEYEEQAYKLALLGATDADLADFFGVTEKTIRNWKKDHKGFLPALKKGKAEADAHVADRLFKRATGYTHEAVKIFNDGGKPLVVPYEKHYPPDTTAAIFWLKNRQPEAWRDKQTVEHSGTIGGVLAVPGVSSPEEWDEFAKRQQDAISRKRAGEDEDGGKGE